MKKDGIISTRPDGVGKRAVRGTILTLAGDYAVYGVNFIRSIILARLLIPEVFGIFTLADFFKGLFSQPNQLGLDQAVIQRKTDLEQAYNGHLLLNILTALLGIILALLSIPFLQARYDPSVALVLVVMMVGVFIQAVTSTQSTYLRKHFAFGRLSIAQTVGALVAFGLSTYLAGQGFGVWALVAVSLSMAAVNFFILWLFSDWRPTLKIDWQVNRQLLMFGFIVWVGGFLGFIMLQFDDFLVGNFAGLTVLGFYSKAYSLAQQPLGLFSQVINKVAGPMIAELKQDRAKLEKSFNLILSAIFKGTIYIAMVLFLWAPEIIVLLIGEKWLPMVPMFRALILYLIAQPVWDVMVSFFTFIGKPKLYVRGQAIQSLTLISVGSLVVYWFGGLGAALIVSGIVSLVTIVFLIRYVAAEISLDWRNNFIWPMFAATGAGIVSDWLISKYLNIGLVFWVSVLILPTGLYLGLIWLLQGKKLTEDIKFVYQTFRQDESRKNVKT